MRIITCNVNGIRSAAKKGFFSWAQQQQADFICLQETKAQLGSLLPLESLLLPGYQCYHHDAIKPGYSGVAIYTPHTPATTTHTLGWASADQEGRFLRLDFPERKLSLVSIYLPSGSAGEHRQALKYEFMEKFLPLLKNMLTEKQAFILCGDWNIAHQPIDLKNWRANQKNSGFLPEERAWLDSVFQLGWIDAFRVVNQQPEQYTWWSNRGQAWAKNVGWRIDYQLVTPELKDNIQSAAIYKDERFSDHAPLIIDYTI